MMYEREKDNPNSPVAKQTRKILTSKQTIDDIRSKIAEIKEDKHDQKEIEQPIQQKEPTASDLPQTAENSVSVQNICPSCQTKNPESSKFCRNCGAPFSGQG